MKRVLTSLCLVVAILAIASVAAAENGPKFGITSTSSVRSTNISR